MGRYKRRNRKKKSVSINFNLPPIHEAVKKIYEYASQIHDEMYSDDSGLKPDRP